MIGTALNHYRIIKALGSGGMGEVYEAEDTKLHRSVAVKVLPAAVAADPERRQRFEREARAIAALNHANIVTVYSIEQAGDRLFLTMELVRGRTLSGVIPRRGMEVAPFLQFALPIAEALSAAHRQGIIHRDLKPDNIMVGDDGQVKILDFGLAQLKEVGRDAEAVTMPGTQQLTGEGQVVGTVAYMSPEQAQGAAVDTRSDIFSLGIVFFEMATGERPFKGDNTISILSSIVKDHAPSILTVNPAQPAELARIIRRSLAKDPARRYQTAADLWNDLEDVRQQLESGGGFSTSRRPSQSGSRLREAIAWIVAAASLIALFVGLSGRLTSVDRATDVFSVLPPEKTTLTEGEAPQVSPDGRTIAFVATDHSGRTLLYLRDRGALAARALPESDDATLPFWSPDSRSIGFFAGGKLKRVDVSGGRPQTLATAPVPRGATWSKDDVILFVPFPEQPPHRVAAAGGTPTTVPVTNDGLRWLPSFLPDGRHYVYLSYGRGQQSPGIYIGTTDAPDARQLVASHTSATFARSGHLIFRREESLVAQRLNAETLQLEGAAVAVADHVSFNPITQQTLASASDDGVLAYLGAEQVWQLAWFDRTGRRLTDAGTIGGYNSLCLASDGSRVVYDLADPNSGNVDLWSLDLTNSTTTRLTFHPAADFYVACSPTADEVIFSSPRDGTPNLYRLPLSSPGGETSLGKSRVPMLPTQWSRDGRFLLFSAFSPATDFDVWMQPLSGGEPFTVVATDAVEKGGQLSSDGRWVAYAAGYGGNYEVYVQPFPATGARWQVSKGGGRQPQWAPDGRRLFYISPEKKLIAVDVDGSTGRFAHGASRLLIDTRVGGWERTHLGNPYAITADGERFLVANAGDETLPITVIVNWQSTVAGAQK